MGDLALFLPLFIVLGAFMFFASRRQKKAMQATVDLHESLSIGDRVHTTSGMEATITGITADSVDLEIAPGVITTWMKLAVRDRIEPTDESDEYDESEDGAHDVHALDPAPDVQPTGSTESPSETSAKADPTSSPKTDS